MIIFILIICIVVSTIVGIILFHGGSAIGRFFGEEDFDTWYERQTKKGNLDPPIIIKLKDNFYRYPGDDNHYRRQADCVKAYWKRQWEQQQKNGERPIAMVVSEDEYSQDLAHVLGKD